MGRPPIKSTKALTKAKLDSEASFKLSKKGMNLALVEMLERVDPLEAVAVISATFMVYDIIKKTPEFIAQAQLTFTDTITNLFLGPIFKPLYDAIFNPQTELTDKQKEEFAQIRDSPDFILFVKSYAIAYIMIKHSGQIISGIGNVTGFIAGFLGLKAV